MRTAIISLTENGRKLSERIAGTADFFSADRFCFHSHTDEDSHSFYDLSRLVSGIFSEYGALVFICACGIAVRSAAPYLRSKTTDPAVIVIDDCGKYVIPILSGHIGGANALAEKLAALIDAQAVITTATDTGGHFSPDCFAAANGLIITDMSAAKSVAAAVLDGEMIGFVSSYEYRNMPEELSADTDCRTGIYVGCGDAEPFLVTLKLIPRNVTLGIGCKRGTDCAAIEKAVLSALKNEGIALERVRNIATIDLKANEQGLLEFCSRFDLEMTVYSADELMEVPGCFTSSDFVKSISGADNVCERSAVRSSGGKLLIRKTAIDGVTVAAAESPLILDFGRRML